MDDNPILGLDTSAINWLLDDPNSTALLPKIRSRFHVRLSATAAGELIATPDAPRRSKLLALCKELVASGDCIHRAYELLQILIRDSEASPTTFDWQSVDIRFQEAEDVLRNDAAFAQPGAKRPANPGEFLERLRMRGSFDKMASALYAYVSERNPRHDPPPAAAVEHFLRSCPPFLAFLLGLCVAWYARSLKPSERPYMKAGALDTSMAVCLPYCHIFVTNDDGMQNCFTEIGRLAGLPVEVTSYNRFRQRLT